MPVIPMTRCETRPIACRDIPGPVATTGTRSFDAEVAAAGLWLTSDQPLVSMASLQPKVA